MGQEEKEEAPPGQGSQKWQTKPKVKMKGKFEAVPSPGILGGPNEKLLFRQGKEKRPQPLCGALCR
jgi:hypothetical protein